MSYAQTGNHLKHPSMVEWINELWHLIQQNITQGIFFFFFKAPSSDKCSAEMSVTDAGLRQSSRTQEGTSCVILFIRGPRSKAIYDGKARSVVILGVGVGPGEELGEPARAAGSFLCFHPGECFRECVICKNSSSCSLEMCAFHHKLSL